MRSIPFIAAAVLFSSSDIVTAQKYLPATLNPNTTELNARSNYPFQRATNKLQNFYDAAETGGPFIAAKLSYRWDGPTGPGGGVGPYTIARFRVYIGTSTLGIAQLGANFAANFAPNAPTLGFDAALNYLPQGPLIPGPQPWGGQNNQFVFPMTTPVAIAVPAGGSFGVEIRSENGTNNSLSNALVDAHQTTGGLVAGTVTYAGTGCPGGQGLAATSITIPVPQAAPGTALSINGGGYAPNSPVLTIVGASNTSSGGIPLPLALPGTSPACNLYVSLDIFPALTQVAPATGTFLPYQDGSFISIPKDPALNGAKLFLQNMGISAPWSGNPFGISLSNYATVTLGSYTTPSNGVWFNGHHLSVLAEAGSFQNTVGYALRVE